jgi:hypothetical protein
MSANASQDAPGHPTKDDPERPERDGREATHDDGSNDDEKESPDPPDHGLPTFGPSRFLLVVPAETDIRDLGELWERWQATDDPEQADLSGWSA